MLYLSVDSIGEKFATCEDDEGLKHEIYIKRLPANTKEGDIIIVKDNGDIFMDKKEKDIRQSLAVALLNKIIKDSPEDGQTWLDVNNMVKFTDVFLCYT